MKRKQNNFYSKSLLKWLLWLPCWAAGAAWAQPVPVSFNFGGDYVTANQNLSSRLESRQPGVDVDGDGLNDDFRLTYAFSNELPLSPTTGYTGPVFYGGYTVTRLDNTTNYNPQERRMVQYVTGQDRFSFRHQPSILGNMHMVLYFAKESFQGVPEGYQVSFVSGSTVSISMSLQRFESLGTVRWLVRQGDQFYVSQATPTAGGNGGSISLSFSADTSDGFWAPFDPAANLNFDQDGAVFSEQNFSDITAIGLVVDKDVFNTGRSWLGFDRIQMQAVANPILNVPPTANFTYQINAATAPALVDFDATTSSDAEGPIAQYIWDFGDGKYGTGAQVSHVYQSGGSFMAKLIVLDADRDTASFANTVVLNSAPVAKFTYTPKTGDAPLLVAFDAATSTDAEGALTYLWDFGDGQTDTLVSTTHSYAQAGTYKASLTVTDLAGVSATVVQYVKVSQVLLSWASLDHVTANRTLRAGTHTSQIFDADADGLSDDVLAQLPFSESVTLSPTANYTGPAFYGGVRRLALNKTSVGTSTGSIINTTPFDQFDLRHQENGNFHLVLFFDKAAFVGVGANDQVSFDANSSIRVTFQRFESLGSVRWLVREGAQYYVSETQLVNSGTATSQLTFASSTNDGNWATFDPATDINFDAANAVFAPQNFSNVTAVGFVVDKDAISNVRHWIAFNQVYVRAVIGSAGNVAPDALLAAPAYTRVGTIVNFDASKSTDADGTVVDFAWVFGDGNIGAGSKPSHTYSAVGTYPVGLTITDNEGANDAAAATVNVLAANQSPMAQITANATDQDVDSTFVLDAYNSVDPVGSIASIAWDFGDGNSASGWVVAHQYTEARYFNVILTVTDVEGAVSRDTLQVRASLGGLLPPQAVLTATPRFGPPPLEVAFSATGSTDPETSIVSYTWHFGDGTSANTATATKIYTLEGKFDAVLIVTNSVGLSDTATVKINVSNFPANNPVAERYGNEYPWSDQINWGNVVNILDFGAVADGDFDNSTGTDNTAAFNAARDAVVALGGGVVYFPAGTYYFGGDLTLAGGVVLRGDDFAQNDALATDFAPVSRLVFPKYQFVETGSGTDNSTAFKFIRLDPATAGTASNVGLVNLDINRAGIGLTPSDKLNATSENYVILGVRTNNVATPTPQIPNASRGQFAYQRHCYRFTFNIVAYNFRNILVANTRHNDNITDNYAYQNYVVADGTNFVTLTNGQVKFNYTDHYVMEIGQGSGACSAGTPATCPQNFREGVVIRDNWMFHTMRVAIIARGMGLKILNNVIRDQEGKQHWVDPVGDRLVGNSNTLENRAIDFGGYNVEIKDNDYMVRRHLLKTGPYYSVDGEGILMQECCGGTLINGLVISGNKADGGYIGLYKTRDINNVVIENNDLNGPSLVNAYIYVAANTNSAPYVMNNVSIRNNTLRDKIWVQASGGPGQNNEILNNLNPVGNGVIDVSCLANAAISGNVGFTELACTGPAARLAAGLLDKGTDTENGYAVWPNPASGTVNILTPKLEGQSFTLRVVDAMGKEVLLRSVVDGFNGALDLQHLPTGLYHLHIANGRETKSFKLILHN